MIKELVVAALVVVISACAHTNPKSGSEPLKSTTNEGSSLPIVADTGLKLVGYSRDQIQQRLGNQLIEVTDDTGRKIDLYTIGDISVKVQFREGYVDSAAYLPTKSVAGILGKNPLYELSGDQITLILASYQTDNWYTLKAKNEILPEILYLSKNQKYVAMQKGVLLIVSEDDKLLKKVKDAMDEQFEFQNREFQ
ncbi:MAG: hypothetical protein GY931_03900 [Maribacter sp.]|nr:hypothetical protein [Maribacter sp.]